MTRCAITTPLFERNISASKGHYCPSLGRLQAAACLSLRQPRQLVPLSAALARGRPWFTAAQTHRRPTADALVWSDHAGSGECWVSLRSQSSARVLSLPAAPHFYTAPSGRRFGSACQARSNPTINGEPLPCDTSPATPLAPSYS